MSDREIVSIKGVSYPFGVSKAQNGNINFAMPIHTQLECGVVLYHGKTKSKQKITFDELHRIGNVYAMQLDSAQLEGYYYKFFEGEREFVDTYAKGLMGNEKWGECNSEKLYGKIQMDQFDWEDDKLCMTPYEKSILYLLHVRGFTKHTSSKVKNKGTFEGLIEKIPYLLELGITAVEYMPVYDFTEVETDNQVNKTIENMVKTYKEDYSQSDEIKLNYWGYKEAFYFVPKNAYSAKGDGNHSFKQMVKQMHQSGIEVILQFYFPNSMKPAYIVEVLKYWTIEYHVDGFRVMGENVPTLTILTDPILSNSKILVSHIDESLIYNKDEIPVYRNIAVYHDSFMNDMRHFLKSDEDSLDGAIKRILHNNQKIGTVNYITNYYGFTLQDLVSYNKKHNEANGDNEKDGAIYNISWNCGFEGKTKKRSVLSLRKKQCKNALSFLFLSQGTPLLLAGDEFGNSQGGNNNTYCQDNSISWINWNDKVKNSELYEFTKEMIDLRRKLLFFNENEMFKLNDYLSCGFPDVSIHGSSAWKKQEDSSECFVGLMYYGKYIDDKSPSVYVAYNMHWEPHRFALPKLPGNSNWKVLIETEEAGLELEETVLRKATKLSKKVVGMKKEGLQKDIMVSPRSVTVLIERAKT